MPTLYRYIVLDPWSLVYLDTDGTFEARTPVSEKTKSFETEDAAKAAITALNRSDGELEIVTLPEPTSLRVPPRRRSV